MVFFYFFFSTVIYKGIFLPIPDSWQTTECPPTVTVDTQQTMMQWNAFPGRISAKPSKKATSQKNTDYDIFDPTVTPRTTTTTTASQSNRLEKLDPDKQQSNINIEIHNVFSFNGESMNSSNPLKPNKNDSVNRVTSIVHHPNPTEHNLSEAEFDFN